MSSFKEMTGRGFGDFLKDPLDIKGFASGKRPRNLRNLADPSSIGMAAPDKRLRIAGTIAATIASAGGASAAAGGAGAGSAGAAGGAGASGGTAAGAGAAGAAGGVDGSGSGAAAGGTAAGTTGAASSGGGAAAGGTTSAPWWQQFTSMSPPDMGGGQNTQDAYQRMKMKRMIATLRGQNANQY